MNYSVYRFTLNMHTHRSQASVSAIYGDTAVRLLISLTDGGMPYLIGDGCTAVLSGTKANGNKLWDRCVIINNGATIQYDFTAQTSNCAGVTNCEITLYDAEGKVVTAPKFTIVIDEREVKDDDIPISETDTAFLDKIAADETARVKAEAERDSAEADRVQAEAKRTEDFATFIKEVEDAEAVRAKDETDRVDAEVARANAEAGRAEAETQRYNEFITLTSLVEGAEAERAEAEEGRVQAEAKRAEEFTALKVAVEGAETERANAEQGRVKAEINRQQVVEELQNGFATISENGTVVTGLHLDTDSKAYKYTFQVRGCKFNKTDGAISVGAEENIGSPVTIDLPLESVVVSGRYDHTNKQVVLTLKDGSTVAFSVIDLVSGLVSSETFSYSISLINTSLNTHSASITALENKHSQHGTRISGAEANIANHGKRISDAETKLTEQETRIESIEEDLRTEDEIKTLIATETEGKVDKIIDKNARLGSITVTENDGTQKAYKLDNMAEAQAIVVRDGASNFYIDKPIYNNHATNKRYVDEATAPIAENANKIADNTKRIENLENTLLTFGEDDSVAYIKNAPGGSAPNVMLNSVGGRSKKSKNLLPYMKTGIQVVDYTPYTQVIVAPGETREIGGLTVRLNFDGSIYLHSEGVSGSSKRIAFCWNTSQTKVTEGGVDTYIPKGGLQVHGKYTFSIGGASRNDGHSLFVWSFDSSSSSYIKSVASGFESITINCTELECNNIQLIGFQLAQGTVIDTTFYPMLNEGDTVLPFEINEGITESAVTEIKEMSEQLLDPSKLEVGYYDTSTGKLTFAQNFRSFRTPLKAGEYTISSDIPLKLARRLEGDTVLNSGAVTPHTFTVVEDSNFGFSFRVNDGIEGDIANAKIMLNRGKEAMPYAEFGTVVDTFPIPTEMLQRPELADYGKEFTYIDFDRKVFVDAGHDITFNGSEVWSIDDPLGANPDFYFYTVVTPKPDISTITPATVTEGFKDVINQITQRIPKESVRTVSNSTIYFHSDVATTLAQWKAYLAAKPIKVRYRVAEPVETDISQYLTGYDKYKMLKVGSGDIVFHNEKKNEVPSTITYVKAKE